MDGGLIFLIILIFLVLLPLAGFILFTRYRAHQRGLPPPPLSAYNPLTIFRSSRTTSTYSTPSSSTSPLTWLKEKFSSLRGSGNSNNPRGIGRSTRGFGPLDPDGAWDDRVGNEAEHLGAGGEYEEQELGLHPIAHGGRGGGGQYGGGYGGYDDHEHDGPQELPAYGEERGRTRSRDPDGFIGGGREGLEERYNEEMHGGENPFGEGAERSDLRGVSPRPYLDEGTEYRGAGGVGVGRGGETGGSRKSLFREGV